MQFSRNVFEYELDEASSNFTLTRTLISTGWPLKGGQYWEMVLKGIRAKAKQALSLQWHSNLVHPARLLYYGGARWCAAAEQCFTALIELLSREQPSSASTQEQIDWLIRMLESKSLSSLQQLCIWRVRKALGMDLLHKVSQLAWSLPEHIRDRLTLKSAIGESFEHFLDRNLKGKEKLCISTEQILSIFFYLLESPARLFLHFHLPNGHQFSLLDLLVLAISSEYVDPLQRVLDVCINKQKDVIADEMGEMLRAALNCAILHDCKQLVQYLLDKLCQTGTQILRAGRSPFVLAHVLEADVCKPNRCMSEALRSSLETSATTCSISGLVVACLADSIDSLELLREHQSTFDLSQVSSRFSLIFQALDAQSVHTQAACGFP